MSPAPERSVIASTHGYHPITTDLGDILDAGHFDQLLVFGPGVPDVVDLVSETRVLLNAPVTLPKGVYWFAGISPSAVLLVREGASPGASTSVESDKVEDGSALHNALAWIDSVWDDAVAVPKPAFAVGEDVIVLTDGRDGMIRPRRRYESGRWVYSVFTAGRVDRHDEADLRSRPMIDDATTWVSTLPVAPNRFAATLTRAKLEGNFTDTMFSFRATRTLFRPYQFKPVQRLLDTGTLRLLIADEVGLGKTIEAGLVWTELEARRQADRVLVVCPSSLVQKWKREMEDRFGFTMIELDNKGLAELFERLETDRVPRRVAYVCSIERLRVWDRLQEVTQLGLQFDLSIVDEAHAFRNADTKSFSLGEQIQDWSDAFVMLSATPVNLRNRDLFNLLSLLVPGEFDDVESLETRIAPNRVLHRLTKSLTDPSVTNAHRRSWLADLDWDVFGRILKRRPDFAVLEKLLSTEMLDPAGAVAVKRVCAELNGLSAQITRTRKVDVQEAKPLREPHRIDVDFSVDEMQFYDSYYAWCAERAAMAGTAINFAMQMPLRLAGSCLPAAAEYVLEGGRPAGTEADDAIDVPAARPTDLPPDRKLVELAQNLGSDTKYDQFITAIEDLVRQGRQAIIFTFSRRTLRYLAQRMRDDFRVATLHGGVPKHQRDRVMMDFRSGHFDLLLATKVASEGLDFEFCSAVVNYDLPWNPMEVEQRIGRIDRIGQIEKKIGILNFHTPGTIESDIVERVMERIQVFEHSIGELEPILESEWRNVERLLFDFSLTLEQRRLRAEQMIQAIEMQAKDREFVESAAPMLVSSDSAEIDGLERDLLKSGRYVGQEELGLLVGDWVETFGGSVDRERHILRVRGNEELADHVQALVRTGERSAYEVQELASQLRDGQAVAISLDQEQSRISDLPLLTATHPLTRAALGTPGYRHGRFTVLQMSPETADLPRGSYLSLLAVVHWNGIRPIHEVWSSSIDLRDLSDVGDSLGAAIMKELATASYRSGSLREHPNLVEAVDLATMNLEARVATRRADLTQENDAFIETRRASFEDVHERRLSAIDKRIETRRARDQTDMIPLEEGKRRKETSRFEAQLSVLEKALAPSLMTTDLAVCLVEVL